MLSPLLVAQILRRELDPQSEGPAMVDLTSAMAEKAEVTPIKCPGAPEHWSRRSPRDYTPGRAFLTFILGTDEYDIYAVCFDFSSAMQMSHSIAMRRHIYNSRHGNTDWIASCLCSRCLLALISNVQCKQTHIIHIHISGKNIILRHDVSCIAGGNRDQHPRPHTCGHETACTNIATLPDTTTTSTGKLLDFGRQHILNFPNCNWTSFDILFCREKSSRLSS